MKLIKKYADWIIPLILGSAVAAAIAAAVHFVDIPGTAHYVDARDATVRVEAHYDEDRVGVGSGVFISSSGLIVTAAHVIDGAETVLIETRDGALTDADVIWNGTGRFDISLLKIRGEENIKSADLECRGGAVGDRVTVVGHPLGEYGWSVVSGTLAAERNGRVQIAAELLPGNSGGPVYNEAGDIVGIAVEAVGISAFSLSEIGLAVPASDVCEALGRDI